MHPLFGAAALLGMVGCGDSPPGVGADVTVRDVGRPDVVEPDVIEQPDVVDEADATLVPPVAVAGDDRAGEPGRPLLFDGSESYDEDGQIAEYVWQMGNGVRLEGREVAYTYPDPGVYSVSLEVTDNDGLSDTDFLTVDLVEENERPEPLIEGPDEVILGEENTWDARGSSDDVGVVAWFWKTGVEDEPDHSGQVLDYAYLEWEERPYSLQLTVSDTDGVEALEIIEVNVLAPPVSEVAGPNEAFVGDEVTFDASGSYDVDNDALDALVQVQWNFGDGVETPASPWRPVNFQPGHVFTEPGRYDVFARVEDQDGIWRDSPTHKIDVFERPNLAPVSTIVPARTEVAECESLTFSHLTTDDSDAVDDLIYLWDFGDGAEGSGQSVDHTYARAGVYEVALTTQDTEGDSAEANVFITVTNIVPTADFDFSPSPGITGTSVNFDGSPSFDGCEAAGEDRITEYRWLWGDSIASTWSGSSAASHTYDTAGTYEVTLQVRDDGDPALEGSLAQRVTIVDADPGGGSSTTDYVFSPSIAHSCAFGIVTFSFSMFTLTLTDDRAVVETSTADPGTMTGTRTGAAFTAQRVETGGCTETYTMNGTIAGDGTITFDLLADYSGSCFGCVPVSWTDVVADPL